MELDIRTLFTVHTIISLSLAGLMGVYWRAHPRSPGIGLWTVGTALIGLGTLGGALRGLIPGFVSILLANAALVLGMFALWNGIRRFNGMSPRWALPLALGGAQMALFYHWTYIQPDVLGRIVASSLILAWGCLLCAYELVRNTSRSLRATAWPASALFALVAGTLTLRALAVVWAPPAPDLFAHTPAQGLHFLVSILSNVLTVFCLLLLASQRLQREVEIRNADLELAHERLNFALEASEAGVWAWDPETNQKSWSTGNYRLHGLDPSSGSLTLEEWLGLVHPDDRLAIKATLSEALASGRRDLDFEFRIHDAEYGTRWLAARGRLVSGADGRPLRVSGLNFDVTGRKTMEEALRASEVRLRKSERHLARAQLVAQTGSWELDCRSGDLYWSVGIYRIFGLPETYQPSLERALSLLDEDMRDRLQSFLAQAATGVAPAGIELRLLRPNGEARLARCECEPLMDETGTVERIVGTLQDITDLRRGEEQRRELEHQLLQARRMEAVGQLTGGIAHDFNNLLAVVIGNLDLAETDAALTADTRELIVTARDAGLRGAELTARLLAFSRRQPLQPRALNLNGLVTDYARFLERVLGADIEIELQLAADLRPVELDPVQFEAALTNLATNARDAMPRGGRFSISTRNGRLDAGHAAGQSEVASGDYVLVEISDTGLGMPPEVVERVFDPFFTTKGAGKGTGLGLSMVYGFISQSGGQVRIDSEPGRGTTIRLYLPPSEALETGLGTNPTACAPEAGLGEVVLVTEDEAKVRQLVVRQLQDLSYRVLEAESGPAALEILKQNRRIDLLLTDIIMAGGLNGQDLAERARRLRPDLKVLFMSGFPEAGLGQRGHVDPGMPLLRKPFRKGELAEKVRAALLGQGPGTSAGAHADPSG